MSEATIDVVDGGRLLRFGLADLMHYHGPGYPGGVAHGFTVMRRAWPLLDPTGPPARREIRLETAFPGPGARDAFELVTRAVTEDRYVVRPEMERPELGRVRARYVFRWSPESGQSFRRAARSSDRFRRTRRSSELVHRVCRSAARPFVWGVNHQEEETRWPDTCSASTSPWATRRRPRSSSRSCATWTP